jgi:diaminohydroxyphosphoribosylaminopyrimidine deaminase/5-amino-6-(5-phosphoribosylamino)uracil reductase
MMSIALAVAARGLGRTAPNPAVGAVIADEASGEVIARGWTAPGGRPHAETQAIARAGGRARGATMYVTLEPCSHHGATPPCADAIIGSGISRLVCAIEDPDPRVAGRGLARLRDAGIEVERGLQAAAAHFLAAGHILRVTERRPSVTAKLALDANGDVPRGSAGQPTWATGETARALGHLMRARTDAILVGRRTVLDDDPLLTCRLPGLGQRSPVRVVLARDLAGLERSRLAASAEDHPLWVFAPAGVDDLGLAARGAKVFPTRMVAGGLWLPAVLEELAQLGITRLLVEGGPATWGAFSRAGLIDEAVVFHTRGAEAAELSVASVKHTLSRYMALPGFEIYDQRTLGTDDIFSLRRHWPLARRRRNDATHST